MTADEVNALLNQFKGTPREIADQFLALGIRGVPGDSISCPVANFIKTKEDSPDTCWWVRQTYIVKRYNNRYIDITPQPWDPCIDIENKDLVKFILAFDANKFPEFYEE